MATYTQKECIGFLSSLYEKITSGCYVNGELQVPRRKMPPFLAANITGLLFYIRTAVHQTMGAAFQESQDLSHPCVL